jgi:hypothetical protein
MLIGLPISLGLFHSSLYKKNFFHLTQGYAASSCYPSGNVYTESYVYMTSYYFPVVDPSQYRSCPSSALADDLTL